MCENFLKGFLNINYITTLLQEDEKWHLTAHNRGTPVVDSVDMKLVNNETA